MDKLNKLFLAFCIAFVFCITAVTALPTLTIPSSAPVDNSVDLDGSINFPFTVFGATTCSLMTTTLGGALVQDGAAITPVTNGSHSFTRSYPDSSDVTWQIQCSDSTGIVSAPSDERHVFVYTGDPLSIKEVSVDYTDSSNGESRNEDNLHDGATIDDVQPGEDIQFTIQIENNFPKGADKDDYKLKNVDATVTINGIDDGSDMEESDSPDDIEPGNSRKAHVTFSLPTQIDEDDYDVDILVEADDRYDSFDQSIAMTLTISKQSHKLVIDSVRLIPSTVTCKKTGTMEATIRNDGSANEKKGLLRVWQTDMGIYQQFDIILDSNSNSRDNTVTESVPFDASLLPEGTYKWDLEVYHSTSTLDDSQQATLTVSACNPSTPSNNNNNNNDNTGSSSSSSSGSGSTTQQPTQTPPEIIYVPATTTPATQGTNPAPQSFQESPAYLVLLVLGILVIIAIIAGLLVSVGRRK